MSGADEHETWFVRVQYPTEVWLTGTDNDPVSIFGTMGPPSHEAVARIVAYFVGWKRDRPIEGLKWFGFPLSSIEECGATLTDCPSYPDWPPEWSDAHFDVGDYADLRKKLVQQREEDNLMEGVFSVQSIWCAMLSGCCRDAVDPEFAKRMRRKARKLRSGDRKLWDALYGHPEFKPFLHEASRREINIEENNARAEQNRRRKESKKNKETL